MATWGGYQRRQDAHQVIVHVRRIPQRLRTCSHNGWHQLIGLIEGRGLDVQSICAYTSESAVIQDQHRVGMIDESF